MKSSSSSRLVLFFVWAVGTAFLSCVAWREWLPHDDGMLAQSAERLLNGELPHRDFDAVYTGGLELVHALAFKLFGVRLASLRVPLLAVASLFIPVFFSLVARVLHPVWAGVVTFLTVVWTLPVYFASLPSWYLLFLTTFGIATLFRFFDTGHRRWLVATGGLAGLAVLMKVNGVLFALAAGLALVFADQVESPDQPKTPRATALPSIIVWVGSAGLALGLLAIVVRTPGLLPFTHYAVPGLGIAGVLALTEWRIGTTSTRERLKRWWRLLAPLVVGFAVPVVLFLLPYALSGSLGALYHGLFVLPQRRLGQVSTTFPPIWTLLGAAPFALLLAFGSRIPAGRQRLVAVVLGVLLLPVVALGSIPLDYQLMSQAVRAVIPLAVVAGGVLLLRDKTIAPQRRRELFTVLVTAALVSLLQYPFPAYIYFCYVLPLGILAMTYLIAAQPRSPWPIHGVVAVGVAVFGAIWISRSGPAIVGTLPEYMTYLPLELPRAGIEVPDFSTAYQELIEEVQKHSADGEAIYAAPDSPEIYFLANRRNPTRTMYEVFDEDAGRPEQSARILRTLSEQHVRTVVLRKGPMFSAPIQASLFNALQKQYPEQREISSYFLVMWRP